MIVLCLFCVLSSRYIWLANNPVNMSVCLDFPAVSVSTYVQYQRREKLRSREQDDFSGMFRLWGECKNTLWPAGKMFRQDFLSFIVEFSDWKLKQKGFFYGLFEIR